MNGDFHQTNQPVEIIMATLIIILIPLILLSLNRPSMKPNYNTKIHKASKILQGEEATVINFLKAPMVNRFQTSKI
jgi:hypothetical protein